LLREGVADDAMSKLERESELVWKDRTSRVNEQIRNENLLIGHIGSYAFDTDI